MLLKTIVLMGSAWFSVWMYRIICTDMLTFILWLYPNAILWTFVYFFVRYGMSDVRKEDQDDHSR